MKHIKLFEEFNIDLYEHGQCEIFAYRLSEILNYKLMFYLDLEAEIETEDGDYVYETVLVHAYCVDQHNNMFDATGLIDKSDLDDHAEYVNSPKIIEANNELLEEFVGEDVLKGNYDKNVDEYIQRNISKYLSTR
jgi:hypothetical protein